MMTKIFPKIPALLLAFVLSLVCSSSAFASVTIVIQNNDTTDVGFNDPTPATPIGGNNGTTVGQQRLNAFQFAADIWGATLPGGGVITVRASWAALDCTTTTAILGSAGATTLHRNFVNAPFADTWYPPALASTLSGTDVNGSTAEISARFNFKIGTPGCLDNKPWYYGLDNNHGSGRINLVTVVLHELGHGLGFASFTNEETGKLFTGSNGIAAPSIYDRFLLDNTTGKHWPQMTDAERVASAINTTNGASNLVWDGAQVISDATLLTGGGRDSSGRVRLFAPNPIQTGSSVSHWDRSAFPNQLMEPNISTDLTHSVATPQDLTFSLLKDIGWCPTCPLPPPPPPPAPTGPPPANDNFANAQGISGCTSSLTGTNTGATKEVSEPNHDPRGVASNTSVWYQWQAPVSGSVTITTAGAATDFDTMLGVYTGNSVSSLTLIVNNDDVASGNTTSSVTFTATKGTLYKIAVDGWGGGESGNFVLNWTQATCTSNPVDDNDFFVRNHYLDFLDREPDSGGFTYWTDILKGCGSDALCLNPVRVEISSRFFIELEFQRTGFLVMRLYKASYGTAPNFQQFITDRRQIQDTPASQRAFAAAWVQRPAFLAEYPTSLSPSQFVQKLYDKAGIADAAARATAVQKLTTDPNSRDAVIFDLVELASFQSREYNPAFVKMQYFGYLRRDADPVGEAFWNNVLASHPNNYRGMICAFVNSNEYQLRFNTMRGRFTELDCNW